MEYLGKAFSSFKTWYGEINPATLTGAIDVIVVEQEDGTYQCSPFHVRFGKMGVLRSREKVVDILVNGEPVEDLSMKLGENGEAFFVEPTADWEEEIPTHLATSPIPSNLTLMKDGLDKLHRQQEKDTLKRAPDPTLSPKRSRENVLSLMDCIKEPSSMEDFAKIQNMEESLMITVETEVGRGKEKKQLKMTGSLKGSPKSSPKGSPKTLRDNDTDSHSSVDDANISHSSISQHESHDSHDSAKRHSGRLKVRTKKRKRKSGKQTAGKSKSLEDIESKATWTVGGSQSSSDSEPEGEHRSDTERIFEMDDFREELSKRNEMPRSHSLQPIRLQYSETESFHQKNWSSAMEAARASRVFQVFSDGDVTPLISPDGTRPPTPKSDTEAETVLTHESLEKETGKMEWQWGELPELTSVITGDRLNDVFIDQSPTSKVKAPEPETSTSNASTPQSSKTSEEESKKKNSGSWFPFMRSKGSEDVQQGMYLEDLASQEIDPEVYALYFPESKGKIRTIQDIQDEDKSSDLGTSLPQSPNTLDSGSEHYEPSEIQISLCGGLKVEENEVPMEKFKEHLITFDDFSKSPTILSNQNLVVRVNNKFYNWQVAGPILVSMLAYQRPLPQNHQNTTQKKSNEAIDDLIKAHAPRGGRRSLTSWLWPSSYVKAESPRKDDLPGELKESAEDQVGDNPDGAETDSNEEDTTLTNSVLQEPYHQERYRKTTRLTSEQLAKLKLKPGPNQIQFSVTTRYQGTALCEATLYLWRYDSKIIISDIDGTITKSDVFGQILPVLGKDWTHSGVAKLFSSIRKNGYEFVFLSSRAIGQSKLTKDYLKSINQDDLPLPDGPLLLNPSSLLRAFHKEVIVRKPEEFKIKCLRDIQSLFPQQEKDVGPFFAGFGNRINDTWAYRAVGVPGYRIFTINPQGKVTHDITKTFQTSYPKLRDLVDHVFPPIHRKDSVSLLEPAKFSSFTYWRQPLPNIIIEDELKK